VIWASSIRSIIPGQARSGFDELQMSRGQSGGRQAGRGRAKQSVSEQQVHSTPRSLSLTLRVCGRWGFCSIAETMHAAADMQASCRRRVLLCCRPSRLAVLLFWRRRASCFFVEARATGCFCYYTLIIPLLLSSYIVCMPAPNINTRRRVVW
jgi:hypothetical protein